MKKVVVTYASAEVAAEALTAQCYDKAFEDNGFAVWDDGINIAQQRGAVVTFIFVE